MSAKKHKDNGKAVSKEEHLSIHDPEYINKVYGGRLGQHKIRKNFNFKKAMKDLLKLRQKKK